MKTLILGLALAVAFIAPVCAQNLDANTSTSPVTLRAAESYTVEAANRARYEVWTMGDDGLIARSVGQFDEAEYQRQLEHGVGEAPRP